MTNESTFGPSYFTHEPMTVRSHELGCKQWFVSRLVYLVPMGALSHLRLVDRMHGSSGVLPADAPACRGHVQATCARFERFTHYFPIAFMTTEKMSGLRIA